MEGKKNRVVTPILDSISCPEDLRKIDQNKLSDLCEELRSELVQTIGQTGGHFASSLGAVEITVACHYCFDTPKDKLVWDVGHQAYIHKILTGRREELSNIRKLGGISGFPSRRESEYDAFGVAHAGTSVSAALGMSEAFNKLKPREQRRTVVVIGDGAMTCGMVFEALNHSGELHRNAIIILNDNEMSISPNVGAVSRAFSKTLSSKAGTYTRHHFRSLVDKGLIPRTFYKFLDRSEEAAQSMLSTPAMLMNSFGYRYIGPIDGHNVDEMVDAIERAKDQDGPVLIHAATVKGRGYQPAEEDPVRYHGVGAFKKALTKTKEVQASAPTYTSVFGKMVLDLCKQDKKIVAITAAMAEGTGLDLLRKELPKSFYDAAIAEQHAVTFAAGLSCEGMKPICAIYSTFLQRGYDQVVHDVCIQNLPVFFAMDRGGLAGADGPTHHGVFDLAFLRTLPNMVVMAPKDESELRDMILTGVNHNGPIAVRYPRGNGVGVELKKPKELKIGKAELLRDSKGSKVLLLGLGHTVNFCSAAAEILQEDYNIEASVINPRFVKPLDHELITKIARDKDLVITVEDHSLMGGFGTAVLEALSDSLGNQIPKTIRLGIPDQFVQHGTQQELYEICGFDTGSIVNTVVENLGLNKTSNFSEARASISH